eukprot:403344728
MKNKQKKETLLHRLQEEMGRFKVDIEDAFGYDRKLCKKNITQRTKYLIEKFQSKKHKKDTNFYAQMLRSARDQASAVKLDFENDDDRQVAQVRADERQYYQAIRRMKGNNSQNQGCSNQTLNKMKYNVIHGNKGVEKAIETASKMCRSGLLKINLQHLQNDIDEFKQEVSRKKNL